MNTLKNKKIVILELIPTNLKSKNGVIIQLSALKIDGLKLIDRFDYRLTDEALPIIEMKEWINYDNNSFKYVKSDKEILDSFKTFCSDYDLVIIDNGYTKEYLEYLDNNILNILDYLNIEYSDDIIDKIMDKYNIEPTNHIVDILYEAIMMEN